MYNTQASPYTCTTKPTEQAKVIKGQVLSKIKYSMHHFDKFAFCSFEGSVIYVCFYSLFISVGKIINLQ